jgi:uncharacterized protein YqjF (DUF2071 family)
MTQRWHDLLFAHWSVPVSEVRPRVPPTLPIDTYEGEAWVGVVPFRMSNVRPRLAPALPWLSAFPELNVRTYVTLDGKPGVYFFSLDAGNPVAVAAARVWAHLAYFTADMAVQQDGDWVQYDSRRTHRGARPAELIASYRPVGPAAPPEIGSLADWLTARYALYSADRRGRLYRLEIDHAPWPLQPAEATMQANTMAAAAGIHLPDRPPLLHFARRLDIRAWWPERVLGG